MSLLVDAHGRPLVADERPELVTPDGAPLRAPSPRLGEAPGDYQVAVPGELPVRAKWRQLLAEAFARGWRPDAEPPEQVLCIEVPLVHLLEVLNERDVLVGLVRGRDGFADPCTRCGHHGEACTCDAGTCWVCGCTEARACEGGCDETQRVCDACTSSIGAEDLRR